MKGRNAQIARIFRISKWLESSAQGLTVQELRSRLEQVGENASPRTIYRDLEALERSGIPLVPTAGVEGDPAKRWKLYGNDSLPWKDQNRERTLLIYFLVQRGVRLSSDNNLNLGLVDCVRNLDSTFSKRDLAHLSKLNQFIAIENGFSACDSVLLSQLELLIACYLEDETLDPSFNKTLDIEDSIQLQPIKLLLNRNPMLVTREASGKELKLDLSKLFSGQNATAA